MSATHRFSDFVLLKDELLPEIHATYPPVKMPDFPKRYTKSSLGLKLSSKELADRTAGLDAWMTSLVAVIDTMSSEAQITFQAFLGGRLTIAMDPQRVAAAEEEDSREVDAEEDGSDSPPVLAGGGAKTKKNKLTLFYWNLKARAQLPVMILKAGKVDFEWEQDPGDYKSFAPFGQLPVLKV